jgi:hypothetical protein
MRTGLRRGALIGLVGGLLTGPTMLVWLLVYTALVPDGKSMGPTLILGPIVGGAPATAFGIVLGTIAGAVAGLNGIRLESLRRCVLFGVTLMGFTGTLWTFVIYSESPERFAASATMIIGMGVACPLLAGMAAGALVAMLSKGQ